MKVKIVKNYSETQNFPFSVPQRSVLGPLLFLIFINNLPNDMKSEIYQFVDDVKLFLSKATTKENCCIGIYLEIKI